MRQPTIDVVGVIGTGVIGRSWARLFAEAGCRTRLYDTDPLQLDRALEWLESDVVADRDAGIISTERAEALLARISIHRALEDALDGVGFVQESGPEDIAVKKDLFAAMDAAVAPEAILASSTSTHDMTAISAGLDGAARCVTAHPVNPPHVIPVVEILSGNATAPETVRRTREFMESVGQEPVELNFYIPGFLLNRLQAALIREAVYLVQRGVADVSAVDTVVRDGLGLRWALMGPFGVADTNADDGIREYLTRFGSSYAALMRDLGQTPSFTADVVEALGRQTDEMTGPVDRVALRRWRDSMVRKIRDVKRVNGGAEFPRALVAADARSFGPDGR